MFTPRYFPSGFFAGRYFAAGGLDGTQPGALGFSIAVRPAFSLRLKVYPA